MWQTQFVEPVRTSHISVLRTVTILCHTIQHTAVLIIFPLILQTITITVILSSGGEGLAILGLIWQICKLTCLVAAVVNMRTAKGECPCYSSEPIRCAPCAGCPNDPAPPGQQNPCQACCDGEKTWLDLYCTRQVALYIAKERIRFAAPLAKCLWPCLT